MERGRRTHREETAKTGKTDGTRRGDRLRWKGIDDSSGAPRCLPARRAISRFLGRNMKISSHAPLNLLHRSAVGTLATHLREPEGYPFPTILPFAPDARHRPVILVSRLAEHTRNLQADARAGFLVADSLEDDVLSGERATLIGRFSAAEPEPALTRRYLRYHPAGERYLALGDFSFQVMEIEKLRFIGGFGAMGWLDGAELDALEPLSADDETTLIEHFHANPCRPATMELLGVDRYGADLRIAGVRRRVVFDGAKTTIAQVSDALADLTARRAV